jgi:phosphomannomutase/phosphoglucomutase
MDQAIFRAYSIRGVADGTLTADDMMHIGQATGTFLHSRGMSTGVLGRDHRLSSPKLAAALREGLIATGMRLTDIGTCPTPLLNFAVDHYGASAGLMVTASHNPAQDNGLKIRTDHTLQGEELQDIYRIATSRAFCRIQGTHTHADPRDAYIGTICQRVNVGRPLRLVVDAGNGAAGPVVLRLLERLGCQTIALHCEPDGSFPNRVPDTTAPNALDDLSAHIVAERADAGLAYDGDGDRLAMVDDKGQSVYADRLLALLAQETLVLHPGAKVVYEVSCTQALPETVETLGGEAIPCRVGYAYVHEMMRSTGAILGGEMAGHLFFGDPDFQFDDAILATAKMTALLSQSNKPLSVLLASLPQYVRSPQRRLPCPDNDKGRVVAQVGAHFAAQGHSIDHLDGVKVRWVDGWGLFRSSNTQPAVTLHCEAQDRASLAKIETAMLGAAHNALASDEVHTDDAH